MPFGCWPSPAALIRRASTPVMSHVPPRAIPLQLLLSSCTSYLSSPCAYPHFLYAIMLVLRSSQASIQCHISLILPSLYMLVLQPSRGSIPRSCRTWSRTRASCLARTPTTSHGVTHLHLSVHLYVMYGIDLPTMEGFPCLTCPFSSACSGANDLMWCHEMSQLARVARFLASCHACLPTLCKA